MKRTKIYKIDSTGPLENHVWKYELLFPDHLANWDVWDYWEFERTEHIAKTLTKKDILIDVGAEQGALTALISKYITPNLILIEPSKKFWDMIKAIFEENKLQKPLGFFRGFANSEDIGDIKEPLNDWAKGVGVLNSGMPYKYIHNSRDSKFIPSRKIDTLVGLLGIKPNGINIDIEGAELLALKGAESTLKQFKPHVWVSIHEDLIERDYNSSKDDVINYMISLGYAPQFIAKDHESHYYFKP